MYSLMVALGPIIWPLTFKTEEAAEAAFKQLEAMDDTTLIDDFGQKISVKSSAITGLLLEDMDASQLAGIERGLHQARGNTKAQQRAQADPILRQAMMGGGPAVITGMPNGRFS